MSVGAPLQILAGKYRLERELGRGGMGSVWLAQHLTLRSPVAIKLIDPAIANSPEALARFLREAQAAASLRSPHVVQVLDHGVDEGVPFIVMELMEGESLATRLERQQRLSPEETAGIITQVARAMTRAHEAGIVHRDLKPDNIFVVRNDEEEVAKVLDFGVAKSHTHGVGAVSSATRTGSVLGTPYYMSPEQAEGSKAVDHRTDLWAMGVIAWECLLGRKPFDAETLGGLLLAICARDLPVPSRVGVVPAGFDAWFARACARDVSVRFSSARELAAELRALCGLLEGPERFGSMSAASAGPAVAAASLPLASTTAQLGLSAPPLGSVKPRSPTLFIALGLVAAALLGGAAVFALGLAGGTNSSGAASSVEPTSESAPSAAPSAPALPVPEATPAVAQALPSASPSSTSAASAATTSPMAPASRVAPRQRKPVAAKEEKPAPPPALAVPSARKPVNLGI